MTNEMRTPGVYIVENDAFPNFNVEVATAVPAFIGYTQKAETQRGQKLRNTPRRITSMPEFRDYFGGAPEMCFSIAEQKPAGSFEAPVWQHGGRDFYLKRAAQPFILYWSMLQFFNNGGEACVVVSVGNYASRIEENELITGVAALKTQQEVTLVVVPDAVLLAEQHCINVQRACLAHCCDTRNRFAILDIHNGYLARDVVDCIDAFRDGIGTKGLEFGATYYPWLESTVVQDLEIGIETIELASRGTLQQIINSAIPSSDENRDEIESLSERLADAGSANISEEGGSDKQLVHKSLLAVSEPYQAIMKAILKRTNLLPPSAVMAGVYTMVDSTHGVWRAPANVALNGVIRPAVQITHEEQEDLTVSPQGKSVNAICNFVGQGTLVWGARTLDGNSLDWRYINVRRTVIMLEQSLRLACKPFVSEANDANTWIAMKSMTRSFLTGIWKSGGLAGATPDDAFNVHVGLGETMSPEDVHEGVLRMSVLVALVRPAEFIEVTFTQQQQ